MGYPFYGALDSRNAHLYIGTYGSTADVYSYAAGSYEYSIQFGSRKHPLGVVGVAVDSALDN